MGILIQIGTVLGLLLLGWIAGRAAEKAHFRSLERRESELSDILVTTLRSYPEGVDLSCTPTLIRGEVVIASDYLKTFLARLKNLLGGSLGTYETLMDRAVRESLVRMRQEARQLGFDAVCNVRLDTTNINGGDLRAKTMPMAVLFVNGTAYRRLKGGENGHALSR